jgi:hypothetical protein
MFQVISTPEGYLAAIFHEVFEMKHSIFVTASYAAGYYGELRRL